MGMDYLIVKQDGSGNLLKQKQKNLKYRSRGEYREVPLNKTKYDRNEINREIKEDIDDER